MLFYLEIHSTQSANGSDFFFFFGIVKKLKQTNYCWYERLSDSSSPTKDLFGQTVHLSIFSIKITVTIKLYIVTIL